MLRHMAGIKIKSTHWHDYTHFPIQTIGDRSLRWRSQTLSKYPEQFHIFTFFLGQAIIKKSDIWNFHSLVLFTIYQYVKYDQNISNDLSVMAISIFFFTFFASMRLLMAIYWIFWLLTVTLVRYWQYVSATQKFQIFQPVRALWQTFTLFASMRLFITIFKEIWHLTSSLVRYCQYVSVCQKVSKTFQAVRLFI